MIRYMLGSTMYQNSVIVFVPSILPASSTSVSTAFMANKKIKKRIVRGDMIFYICTLSIPVLFFIFNNFVINFNSLIMAFQKTNLDTGKLEFAGFENFADVFSSLVTSKNLTNALWRSVWGYLVTLVVTTFIPVFFCYYVWKKMAFSGFFKVVLFFNRTVFISPHSVRDYRSNL